MKAALLAALLLLPLSAAAQMVKCVDARGRTHYTDKPDADCKGAKSTTVIAPAPGPAPSPAPAAPAARSSKAPAGKAPGPQAKAPKAQPRSDHDQRKFLADCRASQEMLEWLGTPAGQKSENHAARVQMLQRSMRDCP